MGRDTTHFSNVGISHTASNRSLLDDRRIIDGNGHLFL
jgi:hypothetical protein